MQWITDRDYIYIHLLKNGANKATTYTPPNTDIVYTYEDILDRGTLSINTFKRWRTNYIEMLNKLLELRIITKAPEIIDITNLKELQTRIKCTYPGKPFKCEDIGKITTTYKDNPMYQEIRGFNFIINISGIDVSKYNIPQNTEYLHYTQINDLETAVQEAYNKLTAPQNIYANNYISGQIIL